MERIIVTGIGTEVGKTIVSAIITQMLKGDYWKPIECGEIEFDSAKMSKLLHPSQHRIYPPVYSLKFPLSPHHAARLEGKFIDATLLQAPKTERPLVIETAGGVFVPLNATLTNLQLFKIWKGQCVIVSKHYLGSINHTLLTLEILKTLSIPVLGVIFNGESNPDTEEAILKISQQRFLGRLRPEKWINQKIMKRYAAEWKKTFY